MIASTANFAMIFEVVNSDNDVLVSEPFTLTIIDCTDAPTAGLVYDILGPIIDENNS